MCLIKKNKKSLGIFGKMCFIHLGLMWSSMFHWELGVSFRYGLQVTSTCSQPLQKNKTWWACRSFMKNKATSELKIWEDSPLRKSLARWIQHAACGFVQKANFAAQHLHQVAPPASTNLHLPQVVSVTCSVLREGQMCLSRHAKVQI